MSDEKKLLELEAYVDEMIDVCKRKKYVPVEFMRMRKEHKTVAAISRVVKVVEFQSSFKKMIKLDLERWTAESMVQKFPMCFSSDDLKFANFRLEVAGKVKAGLATWP